MSIDKYGADWIKPGNFVGNGPFTIVEWTPNAQIVAVKNPEFYDAANVKLDKVIYYPDEDRNAVTKRFRAGEIDVPTTSPRSRSTSSSGSCPTKRTSRPISALTTTSSISSVSRSTIRRCGVRCRWRSIARRSPTRC